ncbi:tyrosine-type recombinase/integrase [Methylibium sp.]|uniref:tyrosine-type recombinase/integrase n=1 Tax=Methylibium sp. TaxID=2067992 RepID=UPI0025D8652E|nr:tyrosine-type recombinase/integrase [Methylibium sp.]
MNLELFSDPNDVSPASYRAALAEWIAQRESTGLLQRESSMQVYGHMWSALTAWAVGNGVKLTSLSTSDLEAFLASRGGADELSSRYAWRLLRLVDRVMSHHAQVHGNVPNRAASELLAARPDIKYANAADADPLPEFLPATEGRRLVAYLSAVRPGRAAAGQGWQEVRNRASVGLMLGAGLTPGEVRALALADVVTEAGRLKGVPWKLRIAGAAPARETPVASWAGQLLRVWLDVRQEQRIPGVQVFPSTRLTGKPWGKVAQYNATKDVLQTAGLDNVEGGSFRLRHTFALRQLKRGKTPEEVARWLGVVDPGVMARYRRVISAPIDLA